jgi:hypothetical protein
MASNSSRVDALAKRIAELEQRRRDAAILPSEIYLVGVRRGVDGRHVKSEPVLYWRRDKKPPNEPKR